MHDLATISQHMILHTLIKKIKTFGPLKYCECSLAWMFYSSKIKSLVKELHQRTSRRVYQGYASKYMEISEKGNAKRCAKDIFTN